MEEKINMVSPKFILGLLVFIIGLHVFATIYSWYWTYTWFDMPMHFLGGFWLAMVYFWLRQKTRINADVNTDEHRFIGINKYKSALWIVIHCLSFVILIGVFWEFFEFLFDIFVSSKGYSGVAQQGVADTMSDLFFDLLGGLVFWVIYKFCIYKKSHLE